MEGAGVRGAKNNARKEVKPGGSATKKKSEKKKKKGEECEKGRVKTQLNKVVQNGQQKTKVWGRVSAQKNRMKKFRLGKKKKQTRRVSKRSQNPKTLLGTNRGIHKCKEKQSKPHKEQRKKGTKEHDGGSKRANHWR